VIHFDSSFLIDLQREMGRERPGAAFAFIESLDNDEILAVSVHVVCELRAGAELTRKPLMEHETLGDLLGGFLVVSPDAKFAVTYGRLLASLQRSGQRITAMDLLIATAAIQDEAPLVTRNVKDFSRVPGLRVLTY